MKTVLKSSFFRGEKVRALQDDDGALWFVLADLCKVLQIRNARDVKRRVSSANVRTEKINSGGAIHAMNVVNAAGMKAVVLRSRSAQARKFFDWLSAWDHQQQNALVTAKLMNQVCCLRSLEAQGEPIVSDLVSRGAPSGSLEEHDESSGGGKILRFLRGILPRRKRGICIRYETRIGVTA